MRTGNVEPVNAGQWKWRGDGPSRTGARERDISRLDAGKSAGI